MLEIEEYIAEAQFSYFDKEYKGSVNYIDILGGMVLICNDDVEVTFNINLCILSLLANEIINMQQAKLAFLVKMIDFSGKDNINMWELEMLLRGCGRSFALVKGVEDPPEGWYKDICKL
jgi:hypothetical protein